MPINVTICLPLAMTNQVSTAFGALSDPTRRAIFERLAAGPSAVGDLARDFPVTRPAVSQHLKVLKDAGLVVNRADGTRRIYQVHPPAVEALRTYLDSFWTTALDRFQSAAEARPRTPDA
jgi:DNA-binding transcriptional ArsR family regulator